MRVIVHDYGGYPFIFDVSKGLADKGYEVFHIYSSASGSPSAFFKEGPGLTVLDLGADLEKVDKNSFVGRFKQENLYGDIISAKIKELNPAIVISSNTPLMAQRKIAQVCSKNNIYFVHWLQDILSIAAKNVIKKKNAFLGTLVGAFFNNIEKYCLKKADHIISISEDFNDILVKWDFPLSKISKIENWSTLEEMPIKPKDNIFSEKYSLASTFNVVYSGTLGMKQNPNIIINLAEKFKDNQQIKFVVVATGSGVEYIKEEIAGRNLNNVLILPLQPFSELPNVLGTGDMLIAMLDHDAAVYCVPSKILTYYCAGKPSLLVLSKHNLAARTTSDNNLGFVVEPGDLDELYSVIESSVKDPSLLQEYGKRARKYAESNFSTETIVNKFVVILNKVKL